MGCLCCHRRDGGEQQIDSRKYTEAVRDLINQGVDRIASSDNEQRDVLQRWRLPEALGVSDCHKCSVRGAGDRVSAQHQFLSAGPSNDD
jgi:hypothetical protein